MATIKSIEEKAKRYDEALKYAKIYYTNGDEDMKMMMKTCFPVLVEESEDEKIRKEIISALKFANVKGVYDKHLAWLEKQGEHAKFCDSIQVGDKVTRNEDGVLVNLSQLKRVAKKDEKQCEQKPATMSLDEAIEHCKEKSCGNSECALEHKQLEKWLTELKELKEQKPTWSEEDEKILDRVITNYESGYLPSVEKRDEIIEKLKSLKERYTWKPSDEQMNALNYVVNLMASSERPTENDLYYNILKSLRQQLMKLKG